MLFRSGQGDAPWPPQYAKQPGEPTRVQPSKAKKSPSPKGRRVSKHPLITIAQSAKKDDAIEDLEKWKAEHRAVVEHLQPADILTDSMRGRSSTWTRIRINLQHVPEQERPKAPKLAPIPNPWATEGTEGTDSTEPKSAIGGRPRKPRRARKPE